MREHLNEHDIANDIRMERGVFPGAFLLVEGDRDSKVYGLVVDHDACTIVVGCGRDNVLGAIRILNDGGFAGALAIIDADFDNVTGEKPLIPNTLRTDLHDLECMLIQSPAFDRVLDEHGTAQRIERFATSVRRPINAHLVACAVPVGCLRLVSQTDKLALDFKELKYNKFVSTADLRINVSDLIQTVVDNSRKHDLDQAELLEKVTNEVAAEHDCWQVVCGHDVVEILAIGFRKVFCSRGRAEINTDAIEREMRLAYQPSFLQETQLYQSITSWESSNPPYRVLIGTS